jgi:serine/tyrosine/threonine adenylyltransferase
MANEAIVQYPALFEQYWLAGMRAKLGLETPEAGDSELVQSLLAWTHKRRADFTNTFRDLSSEGLPPTELYDDSEFRAWYAQWQFRLRRQQRPISTAYAAMRAINPAVIPRNRRVEEALSAAQDHDDLSVLHRLLAALATPYEAGADSAPYQEPPADDCSYRTFCGT